MISSLHLACAFAFQAPAGVLFDLVELRFELGFHHRTGHRLGFGAQLQDHLAADTLGQRAVALAAWGHPAAGQGLAGRAGHKTRGLEPFLKLLQRGLFPLVDLVNEGVFEH